jgi:hypothetical protein
LQNLTHTDSVFAMCDLARASCAYGNYSISAYASPVLGETDVTDNTLTGGWIIVSTTGDIIGPSGWPDSKVDMRDMAYVAKHFGEHYQ